MIRGSASRKVQLSVDAPTRVIACGLTPVQLARLTDAVRLSATLRAAPAPADLYDQLHNELDPVDLIVVGTRLLGSTSEEVIRRLRAARPQIPIVAYLSSATTDTTNIP